MQTKPGREQIQVIESKRSPLEALPERQEQPKVSFSYRLEGVISQVRGTYQIPRPPALGIGHSLKIIYRFHEGRIGLELGGSASGATLASAQASANRLQQDLEFYLSRLGNYRFVAYEEGKPQAQYPWRVRLLPEGVVGRFTPPMGFVVRRDPEASLIRLPYGAPEQSRIDWLPRAGSADAFEVHLQLGAIPWPETLRKKLERLLREDGDLRFTYPQSMVSLDGEKATACFTWLAHLARQETMLRVRCGVSAVHSLPETMLQMLGAVVYGIQPVAVKVEKPVDAVLDLREIALEGAFGNLLPDAERLAGLGVPTLPSAKLPRRISAEGVVLGHAGSEPNSQTIRLAESDRAQHCWIIGATGTGKSTLLFQMIQADIERGAGVCLLDPHGDLYSQVLDAVPNRRLDDLVPIDISDCDQSVGINFLLGNGASSKVETNFLVNEMIQIFDRLYDLRQTGGPIFEQYMRNALALAMNNTRSGCTLMDVPWIFESSAFRKALLSTCTDPLVTAFWKEQAEEAKGDQSLSNIAPYITSKLNRFTTNALLRPIIGQSQSTVNLHECMAKGRILLINLAKGQLGAFDTRLLGMLIMGLLFNAALRRTDRSDRRPFYLYVDEAQTFTTETVAELFAEARKFGLYLTLANQGLNQLRDGAGRSMTDSLLGNVGSLLAFRLGPPDAEFLARYMAPEIGAVDLQDLPNYHLAARMLVGGTPERPFILRTQAPSAVPQRGDATLDERLQRVALLQRRQHITRLQGRYSRPTAEVEAEIKARKQALT